MENEIFNSPELTPETNTMIETFQQTPYAALEDVVNAYDSTTFHVRLDLGTMAEGYIDANIRPNLISHIRRIAGIGQ